MKNYVSIYLSVLIDILLTKSTEPDTNRICPRIAIGRVVKSCCTATYGTILRIVRPIFVSTQIQKWRSSHKAIKRRLIANHPIPPRKFVDWITILCRDAIKLLQRAKFAISCFSVHGCDAVCIIVGRAR